MNSIVLKDIHALIADSDYEKVLAGKTVMVAGATGHIAKYFTYYLLELNRVKNAGVRVIMLARSMAKVEAAYGEYLNDEGVDVLLQDICDELTYEGHVDYIFHAAGAASAAAIRANPLGIIKANTQGTMNVAEFAGKKGACVVFPSTREIYGKVDGRERITESDMGTMDPLDSRSCYPESKRMAEAILESARRQYGLDYRILRIAHTYGPAMSIQADGRVMADFVGAVVGGQDIVLNSDGSAIRGFCYVSDTIRGILDAMTKSEPCKAYNLANETDPQMIRDVAKLLVSVSGDDSLSVKYKEADEETKKGYLSYKITRLDTSALEGLGWYPHVTLEDGLRRTLSYFREENSKGSTK